MGRSFVKILKQDCKKDEAQDKTLPYTCYLIIYKVDGVEKYDLAMASKQVDLFDHYYDAYKENFISMMQAEGRVAPNMWIDPTDEEVDLEIIERVYKNFKNPSQMTEKEQQELGAKAVGAVITFFIKPFIVRWLWNWIMPPLFGLTIITYWQALALGLLVSLLFKNYENN